MGTKITDLSKFRVSCENCNLSELCLPRGLSLDELDALEGIVKRTNPVNKGEYIFRAGDKFNALYAVRSGTLKQYTIVDSGDDQVLGFYFPGEIIGFDAISEGSHRCSAIALETSSYCTISYNRLENICNQLPGLQKQLFKLMSRELSADHEMLATLCNRNADEKILVFLLNLSSRFRQRGYASSEFKLAMSRQDIGNYLGMSIETVSRTFGKLQKEDLIAVNNKTVKIMDLMKLEKLCRGDAGNKFADTN